MIRIFPIPYVVVAAAALGACGHVPVSTLYKLWSFDAATADPAVLRAAVRYPSVLMPRANGVVLSFSSWAEGETDHHKRDFALEETREAAEVVVLAHYKRPGETVTAYRLSDADAEKVRKLQAEHLELKRSRGGQAHGEITVKADACHQGPLPAGEILASTYLKVSVKDGYLPIVEDVDLRSDLGEAALNEHVPPCGGNRP